MRVLDLFSGIGGFSLGLERAGMETVAFCEIEKFPQKVLKKHWPEVPIYDDIRTLTAERLRADGIGPIDVVCGGFPCQPFSQAGQRRGEEDDRDLWPEMFRIIQEVRPRWFIGENVAGFINMGLERTLSDLESQGFRTEQVVIPACAIGAPHRRDRIWIVAYSKQHRWRRRDNGNEEGSGRLQSEFAQCGEAMANTQNTDRRRPNGKKNTRRRNQKTGGCDINGERIQHWSIEPGVGRVAHGIPSRVDRLKALGNAVVPQIPEIIGKSIMEIEK